MSSGPAVSMSENDIENISTNEDLFGSEKTANNGESSPSLIIENSSPIHHNNLPLVTQQEQLSKPVGKNHVLQPARIENVKQSLMKKSISPISPKAVTLSNCCVENSNNTVGASGDGLSPGSNMLSYKKEDDSSIITEYNNISAESDSPMGDGGRESTLKGSTHSAPPTQNSTLSANNGEPAEITDDQENEKSLSENECGTRESSDVSSSVVQPQNQTVEMNGEQKEETLPADGDSQKTIHQSLINAKAIKETIGILPSKSDDQQNSPKSNNGIITFGENLQNEQEEATEQGAQQTTDRQEAGVSDADASAVLSKPLNTTPRREVEKPPRMQKQRSQDRLLKQQKSFDTETKRENLSRESSVECVDSTGVDVHEFLITTLRSSQRDRVILLKLEHDMTSFVNDKTIDFMKFPPMTSYHRMLVHRVAAYFGMDHNVDETGKSVIINKTSSTRIPESRFSDHFDARQMDQMTGRRDDDMRRRSILKRTNHQSRSFDRDDLKGRSLWKDNRQRSIEEREEEYEKIRARIFSQEGNMQSPAMYGRRGISSMAAARMASWAERPWNSTDMESLPSVRMPHARPLTTRASSYSSISVLPRHNSATSVKTGSSSSVSSMSGGNTAIQSYPQNRQGHNLNNPRPPTPVRRDNNNGALYYHMQQQNQGMPYLSPEGYQLVYQPSTNTPDGSTVSSPHMAQYYPMPPQPSPQHPGMMYAQGQGYNPYQESPQKASNGPMGQGAGNTDYQGVVGPPQSSFATISSYQQNPSMSTTTYAGIQGQQNMSYTFQPSPAPVVYRPAQEQMMGSQNNAIPATQANVHMPQMIYNSALQGKQQSPVVYGNQSMPPMGQQQVPGTAAYPPYVYTPHNNPPNASNHTHQTASSSQHVATVPKDGLGQMHQSTTPRTMLTYPPSIMQSQPPGTQQYPGYPQRLVQVIHSPPTLQAGVNNAGAYSQKSQTDATKPPSQPQENLPTDDELSEKMQAIMLKNMQQQQGMQNNKGSDTSSTVTTSVSPTLSTRTTSQQSAPEAPNQLQMSTVAAVPPPQHISEQQGFMTPTQQQQFSLPTGITHPQTMQVYFMPTNNPVPSGPSYRTYSQFMTQPQTPHVMGHHGMQLVYLSPPFGGVVGVDGQSQAAAAVTPNPQILHNHPQQYVAQGPVVGPTPVTNSNNNNVQGAVNTQPHVLSQESTSAVDEKEQKSQNDKSQVLGTTTGVSSGSKSAEKAFDILEQNGSSNSNKNVDSTSKTVHSGQTSMLTQANTQNAKGQAATTYSAATAQSGTGQNAKGPVAHSDQLYQVAGGQQNMTHNQQIMLGSSVPHEYRVSGMNINSPPSFTPGMIPQYPVYSGMNTQSSTPYVKYYLPTAVSRTQKRPGVPSASPGLIAVQLPSQNQIQLVPASMPPPTPVYYAPHNHMTNEYSAVPVSTQSTYAQDMSRCPVTTAKQITDDSSSEAVTSAEAEINKSQPPAAQGDVLQVNGTEMSSENTEADEQTENQE